MGLVQLLVSYSGLYRRQGKYLLIFFFVWLLSISSLETCRTPKVEAGFLVENCLLATQLLQIKEPSSLWCPSQAAQESSSLFHMKLFYCVGLRFGGAGGDSSICTQFGSGMN